MSDNSSREYNRGRIEIFADIIKTASQEQIKTHIMYSANLSYAQIRRYITELLEMGFIEEIDGRAYRATEAGRHFLNTYEHMEKMLTHDIGAQVHEEYLSQ